MKEKYTPKPKAAPNVNDKVINDILKEIKKRNKHNVKVLDLGTGEGYNVSVFEDYFKNNKLNYEIVCVDITKDYFKVKESEKLKFILHDLNSDFYFGKFDFVIATEVIEHLENPYHFVRNCVNNLNEDGFLYITSPNVHNIFSLLKILIRGIPSYFSLEEWDKEHIMPISPFLMKKILFKLGLEMKRKFEIKITFSQNIIKLPIRKPQEKSYFRIVIPGSNRFLGEIAIYKIWFANENFSHY